MNAKPTRKTATLWTQESSRPGNPASGTWAREIFEHHPAHTDLVRVRLQWLVGTADDPRELVTDNEWIFSVNETQETLDTRHYFQSRGMPDEKDSGTVLYMGSQLLGALSAPNTAVILLDRDGLTHRWERR